MLGIAPFGLVCGVAAVNVGPSPLQAVGFSVSFFAGTVSLAAIDLIGRGAPAPFVVDGRLILDPVDERLVAAAAAVVVARASENVFATIGAGMASSGRSAFSRRYTAGRDRLRSPRGPTPAGGARTATTPAERGRFM